MQFCMENVINEGYVIHLGGLKNGVEEYAFQIGKEFFEKGGSDIIRDARLSASVSVRKSGSYIAVDFDIEGEVVVPCDRCMEDLDVPVDQHFSVTVKFVKDAGDGDSDEDFIVLEPEQTELDLSQIIYDYVIVGLPVHNVHNISDCNPEVVKILGLEEKEAGEKDEMANSPFAKLKDIVKE